MIGKPLSERYAVALQPLAGERAVALLREQLGAHGGSLVQVRARDPQLIACLFVRADATAVMLCKRMGLELAPGGTGVVGLPGADVARFFAQLSDHRREWLEAPCGPRQTKVLLVAGGVAMLSIETTDGQVAITPVV